MKATITLFLDCRKPRNDGSARIRVGIFADRKAKYVSTGIACYPQEWDPSTHRLASGANFEQKNLLLARLESTAQLAVIDCQCKNPNASLSDLAEAVATALGKTPKPKTENTQGEKKAKPSDLLADAWARFSALKTGRTAECYASARAKLKTLIDFDSLHLADINRAWLQKIEAEMLKTVSKNTASDYLMCLRAVFNFALDEGVVDHYPFRRFTIKRHKTAKRSLTIDEMRTLVRYPVEPWQEVHRDMFLLSFALRGLNFVDMLNLPPNCIRGGRINIARSKTEELLSIRVEPEAMRIIDRYRGKAYLLDILDRYKNHRDFNRRCNDALKKIGPWHRLPGHGGKIAYQPLYPDLSAYWARHTWATIAARLGVPKDVIGQGLGHAQNTITDIYIDVDSEKADQANRIVLDTIFGD